MTAVEIIKLSGIWGNIAKGALKKGKELAQKEVASKGLLPAAIEGAQWGLKKHKFAKSELAAIKQDPLKLEPYVNKALQAAVGYKQNVGKIRSTLSDLERLGR